MTSYYVFTTRNECYNGIKFHEGVVSDTSVREEGEPLRAIQIIPCEKWHVTLRHIATKWRGDKKCNEMLPYCWDAEPVGAYSVNKITGTVTCTEVRVWNRRLISEMSELSGEEAQLAAVQKHGMIVAWIENPSKAVRLAAAHQDVCALNHIRGPPDEVYDIVFDNSKKYRV